MGYFHACQKSLHIFGTSQRKEQTQSCRRHHRGYRSQYCRKRMGKLPKTETSDPAERAAKITIKNEKIKNQFFPSLSSFRLRTCLTHRSPLLIAPSIYPYPMSDVSVPPQKSLPIGFSMLSEYFVNTPGAYTPTGHPLMNLQELNLSEYTISL